MGHYIITFPKTDTPHIMEETHTPKHTKEDKMIEEEDENSWFGIEESMSIYTITCDLNFYHIKLHNFKVYYSIE